MSKFGFVYVLSNDCMPNIYKIGCTERSPNWRAHELSNHTGVPMPFDVAAYGEFEDFQLVERSLHEKFMGRRVNSQREFFYGAVDNLIAGLQEHGALSLFENYPVLHICRIEENLFIKEQEKNRALFSANVLRICKKN